MTITDMISSHTGKPQTDRFIEGNACFTFALRVSVFGFSSLAGLSALGTQTVVRMTDAKCVDLLPILGHRAQSLRIVDVGALFEGTPAVYAPLLQDKRTTVVGFEPVQTECDRLNHMFGPVHRFFPYAIGDGGKASFHRCNYTMTSSLLQFDRELIRHFQNLPEFCQVTEVTEVQTVRLDDIPEAHGADYIKLDVQGAEGQVLAGARACLDSVLVVHTEVEFVQIYERQPLFGDIDVALRSLGFMFHCFAHVEGRTLVDSGFLDFPNTRSQHLFADAVYIRPIASWTGLSSDRLIKLALILHQVYGSADFCSSLLAIYDRREGTDFFEQYVAAFGSGDRKEPAPDAAAPQR